MREIQNDLQLEVQKRPSTQECIQRVKNAVLSYLESLGFQDPQRFIEDVVIVGSVADGKDDSGSDVDVLVKLRDWRQICAHMNLEVGQLRNKIMQMVNPHLGGFSILDTKNFRLAAIKDKSRLIDVHLELLGI